MSATGAASTPNLARILQTVRRYWGYDRLRPLQEEAICAGLQQRDSLVVLPTGGGKSLCYQVPAVLAGRTDVVVSPLIALMKDQVDGLRQCGYPAVALHSGISTEQLHEYEREICARKYRLVFIAPERLLMPRMLNMLRRLPVRAFAIDEAHCISHWGHDFRPEYRRLAALKEHFPAASVHAYTATATPRVRDDIVAQLQLKDPQLLVGTFDRPNLVYRIIPRSDVYTQTLEVIRRHPGQAGIVYCLSRRDTETMASYLRAGRVKAAAYHAGMDADERRRTQDAFAEEKLDVIAATVAFGMGIDRSDVRFVIHATMPKTIEHYQQETGRAGRDGLEAECVLFYSVSDVFRWESLIEKSADEAGADDEVVQSTKHLLKQMQYLCSRVRCRHKALSEYFGQRYPAANCGACDVCLEEMELIPDATVTAQKILSCVARVRESFGVSHVVDVLAGADTERIRQCGHHELSTYALLKDMDRKELTNLVHQLLDQGLLTRSQDDRPVLKLNAASWEVMRGMRPVRLIRPKGSGVKKTQIEQEEWEGVDQGLFDSLRELRRCVASERHVPAYVVFGDATLREMARVRPGSLESFICIRGIGQRKLEELGERFVAHIITYCREHKLQTDVVEGTRRRSLPDPDQPRGRTRARPHSSRHAAAFALFAKGRSIEEVAQELQRSRRTVTNYLLEYIEQHRPQQLHPWVNDEMYAKVAEAASHLGTRHVGPIFDRLGGLVSHEIIRLVTRHLEVMTG